MAKAYSNENNLDRSKWYDMLLRDGVKILVFAGAWDMTDGPLTQEPWVELLQEFTQNETVAARFWD